MSPERLASEADGLINGKHYLTADDLKGITSEKLQEVAKNAHEWYKGHNLEKTARLYVRVLKL
jgi:hypothetical protein